MNANPAPKPTYRLRHRIFGLLLSLVIAICTAGVVVVLAKGSDGGEWAFTPTIVFFVVFIVTSVYHTLFVVLNNRKIRERAEAHIAWESRGSRLDHYVPPLRDDIEQLCSLAELMRRHLDEASSGTEAAAVAIMSSLNEINLQSSALLDRVANQESAARRLSEEQNDRLARSNRMRQELNEYQRSRISQISEDSARIDEVLERVRGLSNLTKLIRGVAGQTNLLALNAAIEAARAGETGRGFAVVADEVRKLSQQTEQATSQIDAEIQSMCSLVTENLTAIVHAERTGAETRQISSITQQMGEMNDAFVEVSGYLGQVVSETHDSMKQIHGGIVSALGHMQFQDISRQQLEHVMHAIDELESHFKEVDGTLGAERDTGWQPLKARIESLRDSHVMHSQRVVHGAVTGDSAEQESRPSIELF